MLEQRLEERLYEKPKKRNWFRNLVLYGTLGLVSLIGGCEGCRDFAAEKAKEGARVIDVNSNLEFSLKDVSSYVALPKGKYFLDFDIIINENGILEIEPGTELHFGKEGGIVCKGTLKAVGTENRKILFSSNAEEVSRDKGNIVFSSADHKWQNITFTGESSNSSILEYCIIRHGNGRVDNYLPRELQKLFGGGVFINKSSPTIRNCLIQSNKAEKGGGVYITLSNSLLKNNVIEGNSAMEEGGGICIYGTPVITKNTIRNNVSYYSGGGISIKYSNPSILGNEIMGNQAKEHGGGISIEGPLFSHDSNPHIGDNKILENAVSSGGTGGGIYVNRASPFISRNVISKNIAGQGGGILFFFGEPNNAHPVVENNTLNGNKPDDKIIEH